MANLRLWGEATLRTTRIAVWANRQRQAGLEFAYSKVRRGTYRVTYIGASRCWTRADFYEYATLIQHNVLTHEQETRLLHLQEQIARVEQTEREQTRIRL